MDNRPFPPPLTQRGVPCEPDTNWALAVFADWEDRGYPDLDGVAVDQLKLARSLLRLSQPWDGDLPPELRDP